MTVVSAVRPCYNRRGIIVVLKSELSKGRQISQGTTTNTRRVAMRQLRMTFVLRLGRITIPLMALAILATAVLADASTFLPVQKTCPLCKTAFSFMAQGSGFQSTVRTDLKPLGAIAAPWPIPVCPKCKLVLYKDNIPKEELEKCQKTVSSTAYKEHSERSSHYLAAG